MYITKEGDLDRLKHYIAWECPKCGCTFVADNTEYDYDYNQHDGEYYGINCPTCKHRCGTSAIKNKHADKPQMFIRIVAIKKESN